MNSTARFSDRVANYVKYRPNYPPQVIELMRGEMNFDENSVVADVGSGTGIFAGLLLENGNTVFGVEPNAPMREAGEEFLRSFDNFKSVDGTSEKTNLSDSSVTHITAAQAFHWFEAERTKTEFQRILKSDGFVVLIWNERLLDATAFLRDYEQLLIEFGTDYEEIRHDNMTERGLRGFFFEDFHERDFPNIQTVDFAGLKGRLLSSSYTPSETHPRFNEMLATLQDIFARHESGEKVEIHYKTRVYYGKF
jgi:SAM-dependent methyltransferase